MGWVAEVMAVADWGAVVEVVTRWGLRAEAWVGKRVTQQEPVGRAGEERAQVV